MNSMLPAMVSAVGWALLHFIWQGLLIGWGVTLAMHLLRKARPQTRYAVACGGMLLCAALPLSSIIVQLADLRVAADVGGSVQTVAVSGASDSTAGVFNDSVLDGFKDLLRRQLPWVVGLWLAGAALMALRLALGLKWVAERTRADQYTSNPYWQRRLSTLACRFGIEFHVRLGVAEQLDSPITAGCWKPIVLVPAALITGMPADLLEALLAHELAHVKRHDYLVNLIQSAIEVVLFYHPSVWAISRRIRIEREQIADDLAVGMLGQPHKLAQALSQLDQFQFDTTQLAHAAHGGNLMSRIKRLLRPDVEPVSWKIAMPLAGLLAAGAVFYAHAAPQPPEPPAPPAIPALADPVAPPAPPAIPAAPADAAPAVDAVEAPPVPDLVAPVPPVPPVAPVAPVAPVEPAAPAAPAALAAPAAAPEPAAAPSPAPAPHPVSSEVRAALAKENAKRPSQFDGTRSGYAIVRANRDSMMVSATSKDIKQVAQLRDSVKGDFLWFRDGDKTYVLRDASALARIDDAWVGVSRLDAQMDEQGKKLDAQGKILDATASQIGKEAGEFSKQANQEAEVHRRKIEQLAQTQESLARRIEEAASRELGADSSPEKIRAFHEKQASLQRQMEPLRQQMAEQQRQLSAKMEKLRAQNHPLDELNKRIAEAARPMGELSAQMAKLNMQHIDAVRNAERTIRAIMNESLKNGSAVPAPSA
ncbi:M48 family metalloprotease [Duganella sp. FT80W]|uniref:M48 family metalloprotease n=1 Tax=Duganella guangzhouensis TaxID=2666084 RepID=A0A6I2L0R3_9BURK|nr:M56 family metallopeptidase [Duganella guangzhouensis]MRW91751.1 M48 family metalloprotease [Duganella guangzhouensis]